MANGRSSRWIAATSFALVAAFAPRARAQSAEAEALFVEGDKLMKDGKLAEACDAFAGSNKLEARAGTLIRLGECRERNHQLAAAWSAYKDAQARAKDPRKKQIATDKVAELEPKLSHLTLVVPEAIRTGLAVTRNGRPVDGAEWNRAMPVDGGDYVIVTHAANHADWTQTVTVPEAKGAITVDVKLGDATPEPAPLPVTHTVDVATPTAPPERRDEPTLWTTQRKGAVAIIGVGVAAGVAGAFLGSIAKGKETDAFNTCMENVPCGMATRANQLLADGRRFALYANISFGVATVAAIGGAVLWLTGAPESAHGVAVVPTAAPDRAGLAVVGQF